MRWKRRFRGDFVSGYFTLLTSVLVPCVLLGMTTPELLHETRPGPQARYRQLPIIGPVLDDLLTWFRQQRYAESTIHKYISATSRLILWLQVLRGSTLTGLSLADLRLAHEHFRGAHRNVATVARALERFFRERQLIPEGKPEPVPASELQLDAFGSYMREVRGLAPSTIADHQGPVAPISALPQIR